MIEGQLIAHRYRLEEPLGSGGMGVVWRASDLELRRTVAVKRSHDGDGGQIRREARLGAALQHPNVVTVYDAVVDGDDRWLVMEYFASRNLDAVVRGDGPLPADRVAVIGAQIAAALAAMHAQNMVHRDVTPANVLVAEDGTAKLTDLGISSWAEATLTGSAKVGGTAGYIAPEVARGNQAGPAADVFSLGATLFAALEGISPWGSGEHSPFAQLNRAIDWQLEPSREAGPVTDVLHALLSKAPARRPSADEARLLLVGDVEVPQRMWSGHARGGQRRVVLGVAAASVVVLAVVVVVILGNTGRPATATIGDPHTADPCSLLAVSSVDQYGPTFLEPDVGNFAGCDLDTTLPDGSTIATHLTLTTPEEYPAPAPTPGELGGVQRPAVKPASCSRQFTLPDLFVVVVKSERTDHKESDRLCAFAEPVANDARAKAAAGPIARRTTAFPAGSLAGTDACTLLDNATLERTVGKDYPIDRYFGNWSCSWGHDENSVDLYYGRVWPLVSDPPDGTPTTIGHRLAFVDPKDTAQDECVVTLHYRTYTPVRPPLKGTPRQRDEVLDVDYTDEAHRGDTAKICATAQSLAAVVAGRLPA